MKSGVADAQRSQSIGDKTCLVKGLSTAPSRLRVPFCAFAIPMFACPLLLSPRPPTDRRTLGIWLTCTGVKRVSAIRVKRRRNLAFRSCALRRACGGRAVCAANAIVGVAACDPGKTPLKCESRGPPAVDHGQLVVQGGTSNPALAQEAHSSKSQNATSIKFR